MSDRETLIADARKMLRELTYVTPARSFKMIDSLAGALAAPVQVDEEELAGIICNALSHTGDRECEQDYDAARAVIEHLRGGGR